MKYTNQDLNTIRREFALDPKNINALAARFGATVSIIRKICGIAKDSNYNPKYTITPEQIQIIKRRRKAGETFSDLYTKYQIPIAILKAFCVIENPDEMIRTMHKRGVRMEQIALETGAPLSRVRHVCITTRTEFGQRTVITDAKARKIRALRAKGLYLDIIAARCGVGVDKVKEVLAMPHSDGIKRVSAADLDREGLWALVNRFGFRAYSLVLTKELEILDFRNDPEGLVKYEQKNSRPKP